MPLRFGASYYHEYMPFERLQRDVELMVAAHVNTVRVGESTWASWEPRDGEFEFAWIERVIDRLHEAGIEVILGTPTYAIPPWLARKHPEVMAEHATGQAIPFGGRQNVDLLNPTYRRYAERVIREAVGRFAEHPAVVGYQVDNETGMVVLHNDDAFAGFVDFLKGRYPDVESVNELWGLTYWSHRLSCWEDLWRPDGNTNPGYAIEWRRFQAQVVTDFLGWQARIVRELARPGQFVTHDFVGGYGLPPQDRFATVQHLDFSSDNPYYGSQEGLMLPEVDGAGLYTPEWMGQSGVWDLYAKADLARAGSGTFLVTETQATSIGGAHLNHPPYPGQLALAAHALIARGASGVMYWHWATCHQGNESYWHGVLGHDLEPGRIYEETRALGAVIESYGELFDGWRPDAPAALIYSLDTRYASEFQPPLKLPGTNQPDRFAYLRLLRHYQRAAFEVRLPLGVLDPRDRWEGHALVVAPALYVADETLLERLRAYVEQGGHLVLTFRTGTSDQHNRVRWTRAPHALREAAGVSLQEYSHLASPLAVQAAAGSPLAGAQASEWADGLVLEGAEELARYVHPFHGRFPAVTSHAYGRGRLTYVGTVLDRRGAGRLLRWAAGQAGIDAPWPDLPDSVRVDGGVNGRGERIWLLTNWSWEPARVRDVELGPLEVKLVRE